MKIDDAHPLTAEGKQLVTGFLDRFVDARRRGRWPIREIPEAFYAFERVSSWRRRGRAGLLATRQLRRAVRRGHPHDPTGSRTNSAPFRKLLAREELFAAPGASSFVDGVDAPSTHQLEENLHNLSELDVAVLTTGPGSWP
jgi:hypothetical protein